MGFLCRDANRHYGAADRFAAVAVIQLKLPDSPFGGEADVGHRLLPDSSLYDC